MKKTKQSFLPLFFISLAVSLIPLLPGQNVHGFVLAGFFYYCSTQHKSIREMLLPVVLILLAQVITMEIIYSGESIEPILRWTLILEKPFFMVLLIFVFYSIGIQTSMSISSLCVLTAGTLFAHIWLISAFLSLNGYTYADFAFVGVDLTSLKETLLTPVAPAQQQQVAALLDWMLLQIGTFNVISSMLYTFILTRLFFTRFAGVSKSVFMAFRMHYKVGMTFLLFWGIALSLFFLIPEESSPNTVTPAVFSETALFSNKISVSTDLKSLFNFAISALLIFCMLYFFQGLACVAFYLRLIPIVLHMKFAIGKAFMIGFATLIITLFIFFPASQIFSFFFLLVFAIGFLDQWRDFRKLGVYF